MFSDQISFTRAAMKKTVVAGVVAGLFSQVHAAPVDAPASVNPANIMNSVNQTLPAPVTRPAQPDLNKQDKAGRTDSTADTSAEFTLKEVKLSGARHAVPAAVTAIYQQQLGKKMRFSAIRKMAADMQEAYRNEGLILVQVVLPPQEINLEQGLVHIQIIEGQIEKVNFQQSLPPAVATQLQRYASQVEAEDPISYATIDRFLILSNEVPGMQVSATLAPDPKVVGGSDLLMTSQQTKASGFVNVNNHGTQYVGPNQMSVGASVYDLIGADSLSLIVSTTPEHAGEMGYGNINYGIVAGPYATRINAAYTATRTQPGDSLSAFEMKGKSKQYMVSVNQPLFVSTPQKITLLSSLTHLNSYNNVFTDQRLYEDTITTLTLGLGYQGTLRQTYSDSKLTVTKGLPILGASRSISTPSVASATPDFVRFNGESSNTRYVSPKTSVALDAQFQFSQNTLVSSEKISYGGATFGQAFDSNVIFRRQRRIGRAGIALRLADAELDEPAATRDLL
jgi:hemolysin activation/secretion protein